MTELEFFPYHNRHIVFKLNDGRELSGVLVDPMNSHETGKQRTIYTYITTSNLRAWKRAEQNNDKVRMKELEGEIDIENITWAMRLNY